MIETERQRQRYRDGDTEQRECPGSLMEPCHGGLDLLGGTDCPPHYLASGETDGIVSLIKRRAYLCMWALVCTHAWTYSFWSSACMFSIQAQNDAWSLRDTLMSGCCLERTDSAWTRGKFSGNSKKIYSKVRAGMMMILLLGL